MEAKRTVVGAVLFTLALMAALFSIIMMKELLGPRWILLLLTLVVTVPLALPLRRFWRWLTQRDSIAVNLLCHIIIVYPLLLCTALIVNMACAENHGEKIRVKTTRLYTETRYHTKRVSRKVYTRGAPYTVFCIEIEMPDGSHRNFDIKKKKYDSIDVGDTVAIPVRSGALWLDVLDPYALEYTKKAKKRKRNYRPHFRRQ